LPVNRNRSFEEVHHSGVCGDNGLGVNKTSKNGEEG